MSEPKKCDEIEARWANQFLTGYRPHVVELIFYQNAGEDDSSRVVSRIVTTPDDAKTFLTNLAGTIREYEELVGPIPVDGLDKLRFGKR